MSCVNIRGCCIGEGRPTVIIPIVESTETAVLEKAAEFSKLRADCVEWRIDCFEGATDLPAIVHCAATVSYTHLDVYKRQVLTPIMGSREPNDPTITSAKLAAHIPGSVLVLSLIHIFRALNDVPGRGRAVLGGDAHSLEAAVIHRQDAAGVDAALHVGGIFYLIRLAEQAHDIAHIVHAQIHQGTAGTGRIKGRLHIACTESIVPAGILAEIALHQPDSAHPGQQLPDLGVIFQILGGCLLYTSRCV